MKKFLLLFLIIITACNSLNFSLPVTNTVNIIGDNQTIDVPDITGTTTFYGVKIVGNNNHVTLHSISNSINACGYVNGNHNVIDGGICDNIISDTTASPDQNGFEVHGDGNVFTNGKITIKNCFGSNHCDGFQTWKSSTAPVATNTTVSNYIIDVPSISSAAWSKCFQTQDNSTGWIIKNVVCNAPLFFIFTQASGSITNSTFIGMGVPLPQGGKIPGTSAFTIRNNIWENALSSGGAFFPTTYPDPNLISDHNCYWNNSSRPVNVGDIFANPLLDVTYHLPVNSPCIGMGAFPMPIATPTPTFTSTSTLTSTPTNTLTLIPTNTNTPTPTFTPTPRCEDATTESLVIHICFKP